MKSFPANQWRLSMVRMAKSATLMLFPVKSIDEYMTVLAD